MRSTELRIGNLFQDQNRFLLEVAELTEENQVFKVVDRSKFPLPDGWQAEPIPITEEWLVKFRFEKVGRFYRRGAITAEVCNNFCRLCLCGKFITNVEFVHSLQNLYFCLSKKELI